MAAEERPQPEPGCDLFLAWEPTERADAFALATEGRRAGLAAQLDLAGRSIKGQMKQADRAGARYVAILYPDGTVLRDMDSGQEEKVERQGVVRRRAEGAPRAVRQPPRANDYRDAWCGELTADRAGTRAKRRRLGSPPA